jgi:hypothetical protein
MAKIEISDETLDDLLKDVLIQDYRSFINNIKQLEAVKDPEPWQLEDLDNDRHYLAAMKIMLTYYLPHDRYRELFNETSDYQ